jgi:hypothetical protein
MKQPEKFGNVAPRRRLKTDPVSSIQHLPYWGELDQRCQSRECLHMVHQSHGTLGQRAECIHKMQDVRIMQEATASCDPWDKSHIRWHKLSFRTLSSIFNKPIYLPTFSNRKTNDTLQRHFTLSQVSHIRTSLQQNLMSLIFKNTRSVINMDLSGCRISSTTCGHNVYQFIHIYNVFCWTSTLTATDQTCQLVQKKPYGSSAHNFTHAWYVTPATRPVAQLLCLHIQ